MIPQPKPLRHGRGGECEICGAVGPLIEIRPTSASHTMMVCIRCFRKFRSRWFDLTDFGEEDEGFSDKWRAESFAAYDEKDEGDIAEAIEEIKLHNPNLKDWPDSAIIALALDELAALYWTRNQKNGWKEKEAETFEAEYIPNIDEMIENPAGYYTMWQSFCEYLGVTDAHSAWRMVEKPWKWRPELEQWIEDPEWFDQEAESFAANPLANPIPECCDGEMDFLGANADGDAVWLCPDCNSQYTTKMRRVKLCSRCTEPIDECVCAELYEAESFNAEYTYGGDEYSENEETWVHWDKYRVRHKVVDAILEMPKDKAWEYITWIDSQDGSVSDEEGEAWEEAVTNKDLKAAVDNLIIHRDYISGGWGTGILEELEDNNYYKDAESFDAEVIKKCQRCGGKAKMTWVQAKCSDLYDQVNLNTGKEYDGYVPDWIGISGDYVSFTICRHCGQVQGAWPELDKTMNQFKSGKANTSSIFDAESFEAMTLDKNDALICDQCSNNVEDESIYADFILRCNCGNILYEDDSYGPFDMADYYGAESPTWMAEELDPSVFTDLDSLNPQYRPLGWVPSASQETDPYAINGWKTAGVMGLTIIAAGAAYIWSHKKE